MPRGQKPKEPTRKIIYLDTCPVFRQMYAPEKPEVYLARAVAAWSKAFDQLEAKGLIGKPEKKTAS